MHIKKMIAFVAVAAAGLGMSALPAAAAAAQGTHLTGAAQVLRPLMAACTPQVYPDYAHMSATPGQVSAHAYWERGTCTKAQTAAVVVILEEDINGRWQQAGHEGIAPTMLPGKIPVSQRPNARGTCSSSKKTYWRSYGIVRVAGWGEQGSNDKYTPKQLLPCHI
jgi:hypothetical protein